MRVETEITDGSPEKRTGTAENSEQRDNGDIKIKIIPIRGGSAGWLVKKMKKKDWEKLEGEINDRVHDDNE